MIKFTDKMPEIGTDVIVVRVVGEEFTVFEGILEPDGLYVFSVIEGTYIDGYDIELVEEIKDELFWIDKKDFLMKHMTNKLFNKMFGWE